MSKCARKLIITGVPERCEINSFTYTFTLQLIYKQQFTQKYIANSLAKKLLAIQSNKKQYCLKVTSQGFKPWTFRTGI